jgi:phosphoribosylpyrophosphate synthetase
VASYLGLELGKIKIKRFADGEIYVQVQVSLRTLLLLCVLMAGCLAAHVAA